MFVLVTTQFVFNTNKLATIKYRILQSKLRNYRRVFFPSDVLGHGFVPQMGIPFVDAIDVPFAGYFDVYFGQQELADRLKNRYDRKHFKTRQINAVLIKKNSFLPPNPAG